jgi:polyhydroxybutyrate depolymerase
VVRLIFVALAAGVVALVASGLVVLVGPPALAQWSGRLELATLSQGQLERTYRVYRPARREARPGLVLDLHSARTNGFLEELATRFDGQAERFGWIVVYPDGFADSWEPYGCCEHPSVDDVAFLGEIITRLEATDGVDPERVYVTGLSRGGMMAYRLACELSSRLAAIAPVAGNMADANGDVQSVPCRPDRPVSVLAINGSADTVVPIKGGGRTAPLEDVLSRWRELNGCAARESLATSGVALSRTWQCRAGSEVRSIVVDGVGHTWPGIPLSSVPWGPAASLDASRAIAEFFAAHTRADATQ